MGNAGRLTDMIPHPDSERLFERPWQRPLGRNAFDFLLDLEVRKATRHLYYFSLLAMRFDGPAAAATPDEDGPAQHTLDSLVRRELRGTDLMGRRNDGSLLVILHYSDLESALLVSERVRERVENHNFATGGSLDRRTVSIGVTCFPTNANELSSLMLRAHDMLGRAQSLGGNRVCVSEA
jgi:hypothetical protein